MLEAFSDAQIAGQRIADAAVGVEQQRNTVDLGGKALRIVAAVGGVILPRHAMGGHDVGDGRDALRRQGERVPGRSAGWRCSLVSNSQVVVVDQVVAGRRRSWASRRRWQGSSGSSRRPVASSPSSSRRSRRCSRPANRSSASRPSDPDSRSGWPRARGVAVARVGEERGVGGGDGKEVRARAAHDRLVVVVADRVLVGERLEERCVAGLRVAARVGEGVHVVEAHRDGAFHGIEPAGRGGAPFEPVPMVSSTQTNLSSLPPSKSCHIWKKR